MVCLDSRLLYPTKYQLQQKKSLKIIEKVTCRVNYYNIVVTRIKSSSYASFIHILRKTKIKKWKKALHIHKTYRTASHQCIKVHSNKNTINFIVDANRCHILNVYIQAYKCSSKRHLQHQSTQHTHTKKKSTSKSCENLFEYWMHFSCIFLYQCVSGGAYILFCQKYRSIYFFRFFFVDKKNIIRANSVRLLVDEVLCRMSSIHLTFEH